jgi:myo-inositol-1(or 4)-monophosphatase
MESVLNATIDIIKKVSELFYNNIDPDKIITKSGSSNYVTEIDTMVQETIIKKLRILIPGSSIIAEETSDNNYKLEKYTWILDPVDGTTNLMYGYKYSAVSLGLFVEGRPFAGIVYNPFLKELFFAQKDKGAFVNNKQIRVNTNDLLQNSLITFGTSPYDRKKADETFRVTRNVFDRCRDIRRTGSAALDLCYVAAGRTDAFFEMELQPWDYAGGSIILEEAGGKITDWKGNPVNYISKTPVVASNGFIHDELLLTMK